MTSSRLKAQLSVALAGLALLIATLVLGGCGAGETGGVGEAEAAGPAKDSVVNVVLGEYSISLDKKTAKAGDVKFLIKNAGKEEHEFVIVGTDLAADALPVADGKVDEDAVEAADGGEPADEQAAGEEQGEEEHPLEVEDIAPGATATLDAELAAGQYVLICNLLGHYEHGMRTAFTVK